MTTTNSARRTDIFLLVLLNALLVAANGLLLLATERVADSGWGIAMALANLCDLCEPFFRVIH